MKLICKQCKKEFDTGIFSIPFDYCSWKCYWKAAWLAFPKKKLDKGYSIEYANKRQDRR